jgi:hypothetical protein
LALGGKKIFSALKDFVTLKATAELVLLFNKLTPNEQEQI